MHVQTDDAGAAGVAAAAAWKNFFLFCERWIDHIPCVPNDWLASTDNADAYQRHKIRAVPCDMSRV